MSVTLNIAKTIVVPSLNKHTATLFLFHGSGDSGNGIKEWIDVLNRGELQFPHIKIIYPTAPLQPYTPLHGMMSHVWFDRYAIQKDAPENTHSTNTMCKLILELIGNETNSGIPMNRIVVGGFSMGGALALHVAYRYKLSLAGCVVMSSFLNDNSLVYEALRRDKEYDMPPLLQFHGLQDTLVPPEWGKDTHDSMSNLSVKTQYTPLRAVEHELTRSEIQKLIQWINTVLPE